MYFCRLDNFIEHYFSKNATDMMKGRNKRNAPIATLIRNYTDKKSGKVTEAKEQIKWRFAAQDWKNQKRILTAFLEGGKTDRQWAYRVLLDYWDDSLEEKVRKLWEEHHEENCSWVIVKHFPDNYLKNHIEELSLGRNYYFICRRLGSDEQFPIDGSRLRPLDYLALMADLGRGISTATAMELLFTIAKKECQTPHFYVIGRQWFAPRLTKPSPLHLRSLSRAHYYLQKMADSNEAQQQFTAWCSRVADEVQCSEDFASLLQQPLCDDDFNQKAYHLLLKHIAQNLPEEIRNAKLLELIEGNSALEQLVDGLDLEEDVTPPPPPLVFQNMELF